MTNVKRFDASDGTEIGRARSDRGPILRVGEESGGGFSLVEHPIPPRTLAAPVHRHSKEDEYSYVLEGQLGALLGDDVVYAEAGDLAFKPRDQWHAFWNAGDTVCRILEIISPAGFEHYFDDVAEARESRRELGARYGLEVDLDRDAELCKDHDLRFPRPTDGRGPSD